MSAIPDTNFTSGKVRVMQASAAGKQLQRRYRDSQSGWVNTPHSDTWDWLNNDYRIEPKPREWIIYVDGSGLARWSPFTEASRHLGVHVREVIE